MVNDSEMIDVSIIIVNYNTKELLENCIASIEKNTNSLSYEIIVSDNDSKDSSIEMLKQRFPKVKILDNKKNLGFGEGNNVAARIAKGRFLFLLNPDTILLNNAVYNLYKYISGSDKIGIVGAQLYNKDLSLQQSYSYYLPSVRFGLLSIVRFPKLLEIINKKRAKPASVAMVVGAALMIKKEIFDMFQFNNAFFLYDEETYLCYQVRKAGYKIISIPQAKIIHLDGGSFSSSENRIQRKQEGKKIFLQLAYKPFHVKLVLLADKCLYISRIIGCFLARDKKKLELYKWFLKYSK